MWFWFLELQVEDQEIKKVKAESKSKSKQDLKDGWEEIKRVLHYQGFLYVLKVICTKFIGWYYDNLLANHFEIKKICGLVAKKYHWLTFC